MKINELSRQSGLPKRTIHFYIKEGLLKPEINPDNNYYEFSKKDVDRLLLIRKLRRADLPVATIRSLLEKPSTANYYLNLYVRKLHLKQKNISQIIDGLSAVVDDLPIHTDYNTIQHIFENVEFPDTTSFEPDDYDKYDNSLVNYYLWGKFLPPEDFTDYQEYIWKKIDRITHKNPTREYKELCRFLKQLDPAIIDKLYTEGTDYEQIAACTAESILTVTEEFKKQILDFLEDPDQIRIWKKYYHSFLLPDTVIYASDISDLVCEISSFYVRYTTNIHIICQSLYEWLCNERPDIREEMFRKLDPCCDIENYYHGLLAAMPSIHSVSLLLP